ncbi:hypothetical protein P0L94_08195 [Microbacter sp. GSS18]|nr:hypothetical protein P0L94_08195 [Microbacter sp. GSS18]
MNSASRDSSEGGDHDAGLPDRHEVLQTLLSTTARGGVPVRGDFVQLKQPNAAGSRIGPLASLTSDEPALDAYLLIHALASASSPYESTYPAMTWAHAADMTRYASPKSARQRWSKAVQKLKKLSLIQSERDGQQSKYTLLHESGNRAPYERPRQISQGGWITIPHAYWLDGFDRALPLVQKLMLLVALDQKPSFELPAARIPQWYGIPESTAKRGLRGLEERGILTVGKNSTLNLKSPTLRRTVNVYSTTGIWTHAERKKAMTIKRGASGRVAFAGHGGSTESVAERREAATDAV